MTADAPVVLAVADPAVRTRIEATARELGVVLLPVPAAPEPFGARALIVDAAQTDAIAAWRAAGVPVMAVAGVPDPAVWQAASDAGADVVVNRGAAHRRFGALLEAGVRRRLRAASLRDTEGRLGCVATVDGIAVWRVGTELVATGASCTHAGAALAEGEFSDGVVTCPLHGSRFDVRTGERLRGPADDPLPSHRITIEAGEIWVDR